MYSRVINIAFLTFALPLLLSSCVKAPAPKEESRFEVLFRQQRFYVSQPNVAAAESFKKRGVKGWDFAFDLLVQEHIDPAYAQQVLSDPRMPKRDLVFFSLKPKESKELYKKHPSRAAVLNALRFYQQYKQYFQQAESRYRVEPGVILAIMQIESGCGDFTGDTPVFPKLLRLAAVAAADNIDANLRQKRRQNLRVTHEDVEARARWLQETFLPHALAALVLAGLQNVDVFSLVGSPAGAMGLPQFLPANYLNYAVDANGDRRINLSDPSDAIFSVANYLHLHGWGKTQITTEEEKNLALMKYNNSKPYVQKVFALSQMIAKEIAKSK